MIFDPIYMVVIGIGMLLSMWASARVKGTFAKFSKVRSGSGLTGAELAPSRKNRVSHRGKAMRKLLRAMMLSQG